MPVKPSLFLGRVGTRLFWGVVLLKLAILPLTAHPFDFWTFVNTFQRSTLYGWNVFEFWNKGSLLIGVWYPLYALYLEVLRSVGSAPDNLLLLHFFFKVPFLFVDIVSGLLLAAICYDRYASTQLARWSFWGWFLNPIVFYVYGVHGHYELLVPFSFILVLYGLNRWNAWSFVAGTAIAFTTKYFVVVLFPFFLLYALTARKYRFLAVSSVGFLVTLAVSYLHLFLYPGFLQQTLASILSLSSTNAPSMVSRLSLPALNLFSAANALVYPSQPINNLDNASLFSAANHGLAYVAVAILLLFLWRLAGVLRGAGYRFETCAWDCLLAVVFFMCFLTNFQPHYLSWLLPFFLLAACAAPLVRYPLALFTAAGTFFVLKNELGPRTFFLDLVTSQSGLGALDDVSPRRMYGLGLAIMGTVAAMLATIWLTSRTRKAALSARAEEQEREGIRWLAATYGILWLLIVLLCVGMARKMDLRSLPSSLAYVRNSQIYRGIVHAVYPGQEGKGKAVAFAESSTSNTLFKQQLAVLPADGKEHFHVYVMDTAAFQADRVALLLKGASLNGCSLGSSTSLLDMEDQSNHPAFEVPVSCLSSGENRLQLAAPAQVYAGDLALYGQNEPVTYSFLPSLASRIAWLALAGVGEIALLVWSTMFLWSRLTRRWT